MPSEVAVVQRRSLRQSRETGRARRGSWLARARAASLRRKAGATIAAITLAAVAGLVYVELARAATGVTAGSATATADDANAGTFVTVSTITVTEGVNSDWGKNGNWGNGATSVTIVTPTGWEFDTATEPTLTKTQGGNLNATFPAPVFNSPGSLTINLAGNGRSGTVDSFTIASLKVRPTSTSPLNSGAIVSTASAQMVGADGLTFANLTQTPGAAARLSLSGTSSSTAGQNSAAITATITDDYGNPTTRGSATTFTPSSSSSSSTKAFKTTGGAPQASFTIPAGSGSIGFLYYDETAGFHTVTLTNTAGVANPSPYPFAVGPADATRIALAGPSSATAGQSSAAFIATLRDAFGNVATRGSDTVITPSSSSTSGTKAFETTGGATQAAFAIPAGTSSVQFLAYDETAGDYDVTLSNDSSLGNPVPHPLTVDAAAATRVALAGPSSATAGVVSGTFTATLKDAFGNTVTHAVDVELTPASTSASGSFDPQPPTIAAGETSTTFTYHAETAGDHELTLANDAALAGPAAHTITVDPAAAARIELTGPSSTTAGIDSGLFTATLEDQFGNTAVHATDVELSPATTSATGSFLSATGFTIAQGGSSLQFRYSDTTGGSYELTLANDGGLASPPDHSFHVYAAHGSGTLEASPTAVSASQGGRTIVFTYTAAAGGLDDGAVRIAVPAGWSAPSTTASAAGFTTASVGTVGVSGQELTVSGVTLAGGATLTVTYGAEPGPGATAPSATGVQSWTAEQRSTAAGAFTALGASPAITVHAADGSGTIAVDPDTVTAASTGNELELAYTAADGGMTDGAVRVVVPSSWPSPAGVTTASTGTVGVAGQTITVTGVTLAAGATLTITYGAGGVTAPAVAESASWTTSQRSVADGTFTGLADQPEVTVEGGDGAGSVVVSADEVSAGSSQTLTFTYTASAAGMTDGAIRIAVPSGWSPAAPLEATNVTLGPGATMELVYGGTATSTPGAQTWAVEQRGTSGGTYAELAAGSPSVTVFAADGTGSVSADTSYVVNGSTGNTIELTYTAAALAGGMSDGTLEVTVPGTWGAPSPAEVTADTGVVTVSGHVVTVTGVTLAQGADLTLTLTGLVAPTGGGAQTWTTRQASTAAGALTGITSPSIVVSSEPDVPALVSPADGATVTPTPTLTATFADADAANTGTLAFEVCEDAACATVVHAPVAGGLANGADGSVALPALAEGATYHWRVRATDDDGVSSAFSATRSFTVDGAGPAIDAVSVSESGEAAHASGDTLFYRPGAAGGTFTVTVDATDAAGIRHVTFPSLAGGGSLDDTIAPYARTYAWDEAFAESGPKTVTAVDELDNTTDGSFTLTPDPDAPTGGSIAVPAFSASTAVTIASTGFGDSGSGIAGNAITRAQADVVAPGACGAFAGSALVTSPDTVSADGKCYRYTLTGTDNVGNTASVSTTVLVDTTAPTAPALTLSETAANLHADGTTLWFRGGAAGGTFTVAAPTGDAQSGIDKVAFPAVGSVGAADVTASPYERVYAWAGGEQLGNDVIAHNRAGGTAATAFDVREDATAPSGGSISSPPFSGSTTVSLTTVSFADADSGIAANAITRAEADVTTPGMCGAFTGSTPVTSPDTVPADGKCYRYTLAGTDNVGNTAAVSTAVLVDTTPPTSPALTLSTSSASVHADNGASAKTVWFKPGTAAGAFTVDAAANDGESGVERVQFGAIGGLTGHGDDTTAPYRRTYSWSAPPPSGTGTVTAVSNAALASTPGTFELTADGTAPIGGSISVPVYSSSLTVSPATTDFTDGESGIAANVVTRSDPQDPVAPGSCPVGGWAGATVAGSSDTVPTDGKCYRYTLTGTDNVGNTAVVSATVLVDTTPPTTPALTLSTSSANVHADSPGTTVWFRPGTEAGAFTVAAATSDLESGVEEVAFAAAGSLGAAAADSDVPYEHTYSWTGGAPPPSAGNTVTVTNRAGGSSATAFDLAADGAGPAGGAIAYPDGAQTDSAPDVNVTMPADADSGLASATLQQVFHGSDCSDPGTPADVQAVAGSGAYELTLTQGFGCYTFRLRAVDNVGNEQVFTSTAEYRLTGGTSLETVELTSGGSQHFSLGNLYLNTAAAADGTFRIRIEDSAALDVDSVDFPALGLAGLSGPGLSDGSAPFESDVYTWTSAFTSSGTIAVTLHLSAGAGGGTRVELIQPLVDTTPPTVSDDAAAIGTAWQSGARTVTLTPDDDGSGVAEVHHTADGSTPTTGSPAGTSVALDASGVYTISYFAVDNVGNASTVQTAGTVIRLDLDDPVNAIAATSVAPAGSVAVDGTDVWYRGGTAGSFALETTVVDAHSGPAAATFPAFAEAGWTAKAVETVSSPAGGPFASSPFARTAAAGGTLTYAVTGADAAGNTASTTLTFREDSTPPATGDDYASIGGGWHSTPQTLTLTPSDGAGSGVAETYHRVNGGAWTAGASVTLSATGTYTVSFYSVDRVGNAEAPVAVGPINVDTTAPTGSIALLGVSPLGSAFLAGTTLYYRGEAPGSFRLRSVVADGDSGPGGTTFGAVAAASWTAKPAETVSTPAGGPYDSSPFAWTGGTGDFGLPVTALDGVGNDAATVLTLRDDSTAPLVSDDTAAITDAWRNAETTVTLTAGDPSGSGISGVYHRLNGGAWTSGTSIALSSTGVYTIEYYAADKVGNASAAQAASTQIRIDKLEPSGAVTAPAPGATLSGTAAQISATAGDSTSGVAAVNFEVRPAGSLGAYSAAGLPATMPPYDAAWDTTTVPDGQYELRALVTDLAGNTFATPSRTIGVENVGDGGPPGAPGLTGVVQYGLLKLRWTPTTGSSELDRYELFVDGASVRFLGGRQTEEILGPFSQADARVFRLRAVDAGGRTSPLSNAITAVPSLIGLTVAEARAALGARGFAAVLAAPDAADSDLVVRQTPSAPGLATVGTPVTLATAGGEGHAGFRLQVSTPPRLLIGRSALGARIVVTEPALVSARLFGPGRTGSRQVAYGPRRVEAGATIVSFRLPRALGRPGRYVLRLRARSLSSGEVLRSLTPISVERPAVRRIAVGQRRFDVPVTLGRRSVVTVQLAGGANGKPWRKTWPAHRLGAGLTVLSLPLPRSLEPGDHTLVVTSRPLRGGRATRRTSPVAVVRTAPRASVGAIVLGGKELTPPAGVTITPAEDADEVFVTASAPTANVRVVVVDVGSGEGVELIRQLRLVYPELKLVAVAPRTLAATSRRAGATVVVRKPAPPRLISAAIGELAEASRGR